MRSNEENDIYRLIAQHLRINHQSVVFHFDTSGVNNTSRYSRSLYKSLNGDPGWPDLQICARSHPDFGDYMGLFIEVKKAGTRIRKRDGSLVADQHIRDQAEMIKRLNAAGYYAAFGISYESCKRLIDEYLTGTYNETVFF
ncbi:PDDEXK family nuclease [Rhodococcus rhodochrous]|uniref:hypothetical protein n=1 Tax=Rhodococcus rhodochrous TaxID=1829 RepID=UPI001783AF35|nr:hypothetical protein [Rhodococcus rhodochrous]QOH56206.1 hypothetical protein C6Y44_09720 [Rhodococcus rhodochrous]